MKSYFFGSPIPSERGAVEGCCLLVIKGGGPLVSGTISGLVALGSIRKQAEQARGSKQISDIPPWPLPDLLEFQS